MSSALIYDVGAHKGEDTELYLKKGFSVVAVEAVPDLCEHLRRKFSLYVGSGQLKVLNIAVSGMGGSIDFFVDEKYSEFGTANTNWVERNRALGAGKTRKITVESRPLGELMKEHGVPRYCKIDIEGSDLDALKSMRGNTELPQFVSIESEKHDWSRLVEEFESFSDLGYTRFKIVDQMYVGLQRCPRPAREGEYSEHMIEKGSSGLFGEELPGRWLEPTEALEAYKGVFLGYALNGLFRGRASVFHQVAQMQALGARLNGLHGSVNPLKGLPPPGWYDTHATR
jgi:FkbM family methyltransferase